MIDARYLSPARLSCYGDVESLYRHYFRITNDARAASNLVLSHVTMERQSPDERLLDTAEAATMLNVSQSLVQAMAADGRLRHVRLGKLIRFRRDWLETDAMTPELEPGRHW